MSSWACRWIKSLDFNYNPDELMVRQAHQDIIHGRFPGYWNVYSGVQTREWQNILQTTKHYEKNCDIGLSIWPATCGARGNLKDDFGQEGSMIWEANSCTKLTKWLQSIQDSRWV